MIYRLSKAYPWIAFFVLLVWGWRLRNPLTDIPSYGDALEVIWGIEWYHKSIFHDHALPFFTDRIFYPGGFYSTTLNHTPFLLLIAQIFRVFGGSAFAYNCLILLAQGIAFAGAYRLLILHVNNPSAVISALMLTFWSFQWLRMEGHVPILFMLSLSPWMAYILVLWKTGRISYRKSVILNGVIWGAMINFTMYSIFIGGWITILVGRKVGLLIRSAIIALVLGSLTILLYYDAARKHELTHFGATHSSQWGASLNSLIIPSVYHPVEQIRNWSRSIYSGPYDESGIANIGSITLLLALIGAVSIVRRKELHSNSHLFLLSFAGCLLALGQFLRWNGEFFSICAFEPITRVIWQIGQSLKPRLFDTPLPQEVHCAVPLPSLLFSAIVPFWEGARVSSRYASVAILGLVPMAAIGLTTLRPYMRGFLMVIWLLEFLPKPLHGVPLPTQTHSAYTYISQRIHSEESIVEVYAYGLRFGGEILYNSYITNIPTASGTGSFYPIHTIPLWQYLNNSSRWLEEGTADILEQYGIRYVLVYRFGEGEDTIIAMMNQNSRFQFKECFDPPSQPSPWNFPICVFEVKKAQKNSVTLFRSKGWSVEEDWGIWAEGTESKAAFILSRLEDLQMRIRATPLCLQGRYQVMTLFINDIELFKYQWQDCDILSRKITIPATILRIGYNKINLKYDYAARPIDITNGQSNDTRLLSVGFLSLEVNRTKIDNP